MRQPAPAAWFFPLLLAACSSGPAINPDLPDAIRPPAGQVAFLETYAKGVQIYDCKQAPQQPGFYAWTFRAPEATLADASGKAIGRHGAGPIWQLFDGSSVTGDVKARDDGADKDSIPWLLLATKQTTGAGALVATKSIVRARTVGGVAPTEPCDAAHADQTARVPYGAVYYFYRARS